ncbi:hypothetical protein EVAR_47721_1 [Eumeta japonica]|uniref:Uncharacterized protein n=1 Tax=Eumeta variegata TaxID=151549 RepID=A0A4C1VTI9_EUMVA|nr:hypothetical protein EVAR_47721_1 [Eumeta japonica]
MLFANGEGRHGEEINTLRVDVNLHVWTNSVNSNRPIRCHCDGRITSRLRLGVTYEKGVTLGNVTMSHRTRERPAECLASLSHSTMIGLPRAQH